MTENELKKILVGTTYKPRYYFTYCEVGNEIRIEVFGLDSDPIPKVSRVAIKRNLDDYTKETIVALCMKLGKDFDAARIT